jgi:hypothetical protein
MLSSCLDSPDVSSAIETRIVLACSMAYEVYPQYIATLEVGSKASSLVPTLKLDVPFLTLLNACGQGGHASPSITSQSILVRAAKA